jgi:hypothetical protein
MAITCESTDLTSVEAEDLQRNRGVPTPWFVGAMQGAGAMLVDMFWDLSNIEISLRAMGQSEANYGQLRDFVLRRFSEHVGLPIAYEGQPLCIREGGNSRPSTFQYVKCRGVWCVAPVPVNYHPADTPLVQNRHRYLAALRRRHRFHVDTVPQDFRQHRIGAVEKKASRDSGGGWYPKEAGVDVQLVVRLLRQCEGPYRPDGVILVSGDSDFAPALYDIVRRDPPIVAVVASFSRSLAEVYLTGDPAGYSWPFPPLWLDDFVDEVSRETCSAAL